MKPEDTRSRIINTSAGTLEIVQFLTSYHAGVTSVIIPIQQQEFGLPITLKDQPDLLDIPAFYQRDIGNFWLALIDGKVVGTIALLDIGNAQGALRKMFVSDAYRGSSYGVANQLLTVLFDWCAENNVQEIFLGTTAKFLAAHRFYEKNGFQEIGQSCLPLNFPVMAVDTRFFRRTIPGLKHRES